MANNPDNKLETYLKIGGFVIALSGAIIGVLQYASKPKDDPLKAQRIQTYRATSQLIGKLISYENIDSIRALAPAFLEAYNGEMLLVEDFEVEQCMKRFKNELNDKIQGVENTADPLKYKKTGIAAIKAFQESINDLNDN